MQLRLRRAVGLALIGMAATTSAGLAATGTRTSSFSYNSTTGFLVQEVLEPDLTSQKLVTDKARDAFGNITSTTVSGVDIVSRTSSVTYDVQGRFATTATNALSQSETRVFHGQFGGLYSLTGPNALMTSWSWDGFGRKTLETRADGTKTKYEYLFCSGVNGGTATCPSGAKYLTQVTPLASDGTTQNGPWVKTYYDMLNREMRAETQSYDGPATTSTTVITDTQYNANGQVSQKSLPYLTGGTPLWITYTYDTLGRPTLEKKPGETTGTVYQYNGLDAAVTNDKSQPITTTENSLGQVVQVKNNSYNTITTYTYDPFGNLLTTTDSAGNVISATYNLRGHKLTMDDPDLGHREYTYNVLGELVSSKDALNQLITMAYDKLGRPTTRTAPDMTSTWVYDTATKGVGKLASATGTGSAAGSGYSRTHTYDSWGRPWYTTVQIDSVSHVFQTEYDSDGRIWRTTYPSGQVARNEYTPLGYLSKVYDLWSTVLWRADTRNAYGQLTQFTYGNNVVTTQAFNANTGALTSIQAGLSNTVQNLAYTYDTIGNVLTRTDYNQLSPSLTETFTYDNLNRVATATISGGMAKTFGYDAIGNLTSKSDTGSYTYPTSGSGSVRPHAVSSISGALNATYTYNANGNMTAGAGRTVTYTSFDQPVTITRGASTLTFTYDAEYSRVKQISPTETTLYYNANGVMVEKVLGSGGSSTWRDYMFAGGEMIALYSYPISGGGSTVLRYFHKDHLGSTSAVTDAAGAVVERLAYDVWGKRRFPNGSDDPSETIVAASTNRGYTNHEHLEEVGLIHMNGRVYDSQIGRFMRADPFVQSPFDMQSINRYSYVSNNPLNTTDPSGYFSLKSILMFHLRPTGPLFPKTHDKLIRQNPWALQIFRAVAIAVATYYGGPFAGAGAAAGVDAYRTGINGGDTGDMFKTSVVSFTTNLLSNYGLEASALGGCIAAAAYKQSCGRGAMSAGFSSLANGVAKYYGYDGFATSVVIGGTSSVIGGGKFSEGAWSAAYAYAGQRFAQVGLQASQIFKQARQSAIAAIRPQPVAPLIIAGYAITMEMAAGTAAVGTAVVIGTTIANTPPSVWDRIIGVFVSNEKTTLEPGPYAGDSIPARGPGRDFTPEERAKINEIGRETGCHTCGTTDPGTKSGNFVLDHQPPSALDPNDQRLYPHCLHCSRVQGGEVRGLQ